MANNAVTEDIISLIHERGDDFVDSLRTAVKLANSAIVADVINVNFPHQLPYNAAAGLTKPSR